VFFEGHAVVNKLTHVTFALDKTMMPGKNRPKWTLKNESQISPDIYYDNMWFTYLFKNSGTYSLSLELKDTNGNINTVKKNIITVK
jgi:PKD repeat protein